MATYKGKITRNTDWGGDASTGGLPVAGSSVQEFLKGEINSKIGAVYKPEGGMLVYYFANEEDKAEFINTGNEALILDSYEMKSNYDVKIDGSRLVLSHSVIDGTTGNTADFYFKIVDDNDMAADSRARVEFSFTGSGISNKFTVEIPVVAGDWTYVSTNVDRYLRSGSNNVAVKITGLDTRATTQFVMTFNLFDLTFEPNFAYYQAQTGNTISIPYVIECSDTKYLEFYIDGVPVSSNESMVITDIRMDSRATIDISHLSVGQHSLQVRAYVRSNDGTVFYTPSHFYTFAKAGESNPSFLMYMMLDNTNEITAEGDNLLIKHQQFEQISFDWAMYDFGQRRLTVKFEYDGSVVSSVIVDENGEVSTFSYRPMTYGEGKVLRIYALGENDETLFEHVIDVDITESTSGIKETTDGLLLKLMANGRRNTDADRDVWECVGSDGNTYRANFSGFTWNAQNGWNEDTESLVISNGAVVSFNIKPMANDWVKFGGAVELDLETFDIEDEDAVICECADNTGDNEAFFRVTATKAELSTKGQVSVSTRYKDNDRLKIVFIGNPTGNGIDNNLIYIVINGVLERAALYIDDVMQSDAQLSIGNPDGLCKVRLRSIRVYDRAISVDQAFNNYVVDSDDVQAIYEKNNVLKEGSTTEIGFDEVANKLPVMIFTGNMDDLVKNGQDKEWRRFDVEYINRQEPERNFTSFNCQMKLQGTSSLGYPRKNFKLKTRDKNWNKDIYAASRYEIDPDSVVGNRMLKNKITGEQIDFDDFKTNGTLNNAYTFTFDYKGEPLKKGNYRFRKDSHKASKWTLKADFMESSCSHNVGAGRSWNDIFENTELLHDKDTAYTDQTYKDKALVSGASKNYIEYNGRDIEGNIMHYRIPYNSQAMKDQKKYVCRTDAQKICIAAGQDDIRTAIDGFPMVCFYRTSHAANDLTFIGQYNFINDKGSFEVFGFEDIEDPEDEETMIYDASKVEVFEGLKNTNPYSLFKTYEGFYDFGDGSLRKWAETYESRYPDTEDAQEEPNTYGAALESGVTALYELTKWLVSTRHESDTVYSGTLDIDATFARRINDYKYGYTDDTAASYIYDSGTGLEDNAENRQKKFETEKWEHFDVWKLAGYYVYLMRYGAVDQFVKNTMLFTDGNGRYDARPDLKYRKWFFINYDNDCLFGLRNNGQLAFHWDLDRQTRDGATNILDDGGVEEGANAYAMMGHDSTLWNNLERDEEFMRMVRDLDYSMTKYKLNYDNMVKEFDTEQTEKWCERIYNANERYKYIYAVKGVGDMAGTSVNNLWMLQGTRRSHRHWWIANHFNLLDAKWLSGEYKNTYVEIKTSCDDGVSIRCVAGADFYYAWGQLNRTPYESNMVRKEGDDVIFTFPTVQSQGDPVAIYAFNKLKEMDFSETANLAFKGSFKFVLGANNVQNTLKKLVIGNPNVVNTSVDTEDTSTWDILSNLEYLDITNFEGITSVPLSSFNNLHTFKASGTRLSSFIPAEGATFELVELPNTVGVMSLEDISFKDSVFTDLVYTPTTNLSRLTISNNHGVGLDYYNKIIVPWINAINASAQAAAQYRSKELILKNVNWSFGNLDAIRIFKPFTTSRTFQMSGFIDLRGCGNLSMENIEEIKSIFGENCFNERLSPLYIKTPDSVFISSEKTSMVAGQSNVFSRVIYPDERAVQDDLLEVKYYIVMNTLTPKSEAGSDTIFEDPITGRNYVVVDPSTVRRGLSLVNTRDADNKEIAILTCDESVELEDTTFMVLVNMVINGSPYDKVSVMNFTVKDPTYANTATISGSKSLYANKEYKYTLDPRTAANLAPIGSYTVSWTLQIDGGISYVISNGVNPNNQLEYIVTMGQNQPEISAPMTIYATISNHNGTLVMASYNILALNETVIMTRDSNPTVMAICYNEGWSSSPDAMKKQQAEAVTSLGTAFKGVSTQFSFPEMVYFTGLTSLEASAFAGSNVTEVVLPETITSIGRSCFDGCSSLANVYVEKTVEGEDTYVRTLPSSITSIAEGTFRDCSSLKMLILPEGLTEIENYAFGNTGFERVMLPSTSESDLVAGDLRLPSTITSIAGSAFETEKWSPVTTTNKLKHFEIPISLRIADYALLDGRYFDSFVVELGHPTYSVKDEVLMSANQDVILRYPPRAAYLETYELPAAQIVESYAFFACQNIDNIIAVNGTIQVIKTGFAMDSNVKNVDLALLANMREVPENAFRNCQYLETISLPTAGTLKTFGVRAFDGCARLGSMTIPNGVEEFASNASGESYTFVGCNLLQELIFPDSVTKMGNYTAYNCTGIKNVVFPAYYNYTKGYFSLPKNKEGYYIVYGSPLTGVTLPAFTVTVENEEGEEEDKVINTNMFNIWSMSNNDKGGFLIASNYNGIREIRLSPLDNGHAYVSINGVIYSADRKVLVRMPWDADSIDVPDTLTEVASMSCSNSALRSISLPSGVTVIGAEAFNACAGLTEFDFPAALQIIGNAAFAGTNLREVSLPDTVKEIPQHWADFLTTVTTVRLKDVESILRFAFRGYTNLKTVIISATEPPKLEYIRSMSDWGWFSFVGCGTEVPESEREVLVTLGTRSLYERDWGLGNSDSGTPWTLLFEPQYGLGYTLKEAIPLSGYASVVIYDMTGNPVTNTVYATSSEGHLVGLNDSTYSATYGDGSYLFDLNDLYDGEVVTIYSDSNLTTVIGTFMARMWTMDYQVGAPNLVMGATPTKARLFGNAPLTLGDTVPVEEEKADITKSEYDALVSKVNQLMKIVTKMIK